LLRIDATSSGEWLKNASKYWTVFEEFGATRQVQHGEEMTALPGVHPYVLGSLARCIFRSYSPSAPLSSYPHRLFDAAVPLTLSLPLPDAVEAAEALRAYADGQCESLLSKLERMPLAASESQQEYWQEELERLKKYATKAQKLRKATELKPAAIPA
jgi:hypothetical protein